MIGASLLKKCGLAGWAGIQLLEEVVPFVIDEDEGGEVFHLDLPDGFHAEFREVENLDGLDMVLGEDRCRAAHGAEVEASVFLTRVGDDLGAVAFGKHDHGRAFLSGRWARRSPCDRR